MVDTIFSTGSDCSVNLSIQGSRARAKIKVEGLTSLRNGGSMEGLKNAVMDRCSSVHSLLSTANQLTEFKVCNICTHKKAWLHKAIIKARARAEA